MNRQLIGENWKRQSPRGENFLSGRGGWGRQVWWEIPQEDKGWLEPVHQLEEFTHFISRPSVSSQSNKMHVSKVCPSHSQSSEWSTSEPGHHFQKQAFRNTGKLFCDITLLDGFCSEISGSCALRGVRRNPVSFWLTKSRDSPQDPSDIFQPQEGGKEETIQSRRDF